MGLFKSSVKAAAAPPKTQHIHNHEPGRVGEILLKIAAAIAAFPLIWWALIYLLRQAGFRRPEETLAELIIWLLIGIAFVALTGWFIGDKYERWIEHREVMEDKRIERLRHEKAMQQSVLADSRQTGERSRLAVLVHAVMFEAYQHHGQHGPFTGHGRPWSRRSAGEMILHGLSETSPVGETMGNKARQFLIANQVIIGQSPNDQINIEQFPDLASVQRLLYYPLVVRQALPDPQEKTNWSIIE